MHHVVLEQWSRGGSWLHQRDARRPHDDVIAGDAREVVRSQMPFDMAVLQQRAPLGGEFLHRQLVGDAERALGERRA